MNERIKKQIIEKIVPFVYRSRDGTEHAERVAELVYDSIEPIIWESGKVGISHQGGCPKCGGDGERRQGERRVWQKGTGRRRYDGKFSVGDRRDWKERRKDRSNEHRST